MVNQTVFENLNQIVEFYTTREFVRGICLKYPVCENTIGDYTGGESSMELAPGCYMELKDIDKEVGAIEVQLYTAVIWRDFNEC